MEVIGIDISKQTFDAYCASQGHQAFPNNIKGFKSLIQWVNKGHFVMESTCSYHFGLATFLYENGEVVSVVNPLQVKRFIQMRLQRQKTDKSDAKMLAEYGVSQNPKLWKPDTALMQKGKQILSVIELYVRQQTALKNKLDNLTSGGLKKGILITNIKLQLRRLKAEIKKLDEALFEAVKESAQQEFTLLKSIPGIGKKTAAMLLVYSNCFRDFEHSKQFVSYVGLSPVHRQSGTSVKGKSYISKKGNKMLRNHLFLCSFTASIHNAQCKALFDRIVAKGKSKKLALIAVSNKLIRQAFGVLKNRLVFDMNYQSSLKMD